MKKLGRNDPCHCGSGKKFKKCCESKMIGGRYMASRQVTVAPKMSGLFHSRISAIAKPSDSHKTIKATGPAAPKAPPEIPPPETKELN